MARDFGTQLRLWRRQRGRSQIELARDAGISQRHVSFLESGRAAPSRDMVLRLAGALNLPLRQQNAWLTAAGFAPEWREGDLAAPELAAIDRALAHMLAQQEPFPAIVIDRRWNPLRANAATGRLVGFLDGDAPPGPANLAESLLSPDGLRRHLVNWQEVAARFVRSVQTDADADGTPETRALLDRLMTYPGVAALAHAPAVEPSRAPVLALHFRKQATSLRLFTTIATIGTAQDVTVQELRVECFFPADDATANAFRDWASGG
jgi:transcriptional regulator with XRE-family HTH domain